MNYEPLVSILVPSYNHERYIDDLLNSILDQSYNNIELLIIDDNSTDGTYQKLNDRKKELEGALKKVYICQNSTNLGVVKTINKLLKLASGKYIKLMASDDYLAKDGVEKIIGFYEKHQEYDIVFSNCLICDENDHYPIKKGKKYRHGYSQIPNVSGNVFQNIFEENIIMAPTVIALRKTYLTYGEYDENFDIEDWEYWLRVSETGKIGYFNGISVVYRIVKTSQSHYMRNKDGKARFRKMYKNIILIHKKYENSKINITKGYSRVYNRLLHMAIDCDDKKMIKHIWMIKKRKQLVFDFESYIKYFFYRFHILRPFQKFKRFLGMETAEII